MPRLSIIVPVYNGENYVVDLIENLHDVNKENFNNYELVLVNDGSKDKSSEVIRRLASQYSNINFVEKENGGIASARNVGLENAHGEYITFCDQDDTLLESYESYLMKLDDSKCDMLLASYKHGNQYTMPMRKGRKDASFSKNAMFYMMEYLMGKDDLITEDEYAAKNLPYVSPSVWNVIYKHSSIIESEIRFRKFVDYEDDWLFLIDCLRKFDSLYVTNDCFYSWTINPISESHTKKFINNYSEKRLQLQEYLVSILRENNFSKEKIQDYRDKMNAQTVMTGFRNASQLPYCDYMKEIQQLGIQFSYRSYSRFVIGRMSLIYFKLFRFRLYTLAYLFSKFL